MKKPLLILIDGNALVHRAFHALPPLTVPRSGQPVNAVYGFTSMLIKVLGDVQPSFCAVAFDRGMSFRHEAFEAYKSQRKKAPDDLTSQFPVVRAVVNAFGLPVFEVQGYEADDVLGTLSRQAEGKGLDTIIVTGDADAMQLVSSSVRVLVPGKTFKETLIFDPDKVKEKYGIAPEQIPDLKGLMGDASDNIPGVPGVGEKTAVKLLQQFGTIEGIYRHLDEVTPARVQQLLRDNEPAARQGKSLATIMRDLPTELKLELCGEEGYDRDSLVDLFRELGFSSLVSRLPQAFGAAAPEAVALAGQYRSVGSAEELDRLVARLSGSKTLALSVVATSEGSMSASLVGLAISPEPGEAYYIPLRHALLEPQVPVQQVAERLRPLLESKAVDKVAHDAKFTSIVLTRYGMNAEDIAFDTMVAAHLAGEKSLGLKPLAFGRLGVELTTVADLSGKGARHVGVENLSVEAVTPAACAAADVTFRLKELLGPQMEQEQVLDLFRDVEMPLVPVLIHMELCGVAIDTSLLGGMSRELWVDLKDLEQKIYQSVGHEFNINSPQQLGRVLFDELGLSRPRRAKGGYSTEAAVLEEMRHTHPVIDFILEYRQLAKLKSTYLDALPALVNPATGRLHTSFNQTGTTTGRLSSSEPNLQNIPVRGEQGRRIRRAFVAPEGSLFLAGDYSQIDLRVLAHLSGDPTLVGAFRRDEDIHSATAALVFDVPISEVTSDMRRVAKTVNFGVVYGMGEYGLEQASGLSRSQAHEFITAYFQKYSSVMEFMESVKKQARELGYVQTLLGRRRYIPEVNATNWNVREAAERMAANMPVQGTSADIIKVAMVKLYHEMRSRQLKSKMALQVHDELIFEVPEGELAEVRSLVLEVMPDAIHLDVPLKVDVKIGRSWGEME